MTQLNDNQLLVVDENGNETLCEIIFTFESEATGKKYVVFQPVDNETGEVSAASYIEKENGEGSLEPIETDEEWDLIQDALNDYLEQEENE